MGVIIFGKKPSKSAKVSMPKMAKATVKKPTVVMPSMMKKKKY